MGSKGWMLLIALVLVLVPLAVFAVASTQRQMALPVTAALHRHYFEVGKRQCTATIKKAQAQASGGQVLVSVAIMTSGYPKEFRHDVGAGCQAASA